MRRVAINGRGQSGSQFSLVHHTERKRQLNNLNKTIEQKEFREVQYVKMLRWVL